jgi:hypothetical protein
MRVSEQFLRTVDDWRRCQIDVPSRAEAVRRLVELAAKMQKKADPDDWAQIGLVSVGVEFIDEKRWGTKRTPAQTD